MGQTAQYYPVMLTRRAFLRAAVAAGAATAVPVVLDSFLDMARASSGADVGYFLGPERWATCASLCARIVPTGSDPAADPGATEAGAVVFIDRFLSAFELPSAIADNPAIWLQGQYSGRDPYPGPGGRPSSDYPPDYFLSSSGQGRFLGLTPAQELSWRYQLYGAEALAGAPAWAATWAAQVGTLIPAQGGLRSVYADGLDAFDSWSQSLFGVPFSKASTPEQDAMLAAAGNLILDSLPLPLPSPPAPPPAASALVPVVSLHTFQATYGLPEYAWRRDTEVWRSIGYDGDTQPLGNTIYDPDLHGPGQGPNEGFGEQSVYVPAGGYREFRPVSVPGPGGTVIGPAQAAALGRALKALKARRGRP